MLTRIICNCRAAPPLRGSPRPRLIDLFGQFLESLGGRQLTRNSPGHPACGAPHEPESVSRQARGRHLPHTATLRVDSSAGNPLGLSNPGFVSKGLSARVRVCLRLFRLFSLVCACLRFRLGSRRLAPEVASARRMPAACPRPSGPAPPCGGAPRTRGARVTFGKGSSQKPQPAASGEASTPSASAVGASAWAGTGSFNPREAYTSSVNRTQASTFSLRKRRAFSLP